MRCFYHQEREAVGICSSCRRGICDECARDIGKSIACSGQCEEDVAGDEAMKPTMETIQTQVKEFDSVLIMFGVMGLLAIVWSLPSYIIYHERDTVQSLSLGFMLLFTVLFIVIRRYFRMLRQQKNPRNM